MVGKGGDVEPADRSTRRLREKTSDFQEPTFGMRDDSVWACAPQFKVLIRVRRFE